MADIVDQPPPVPTDQPPIVDLVVADMDERKRIGIERYGVPLQAGNGRDALVDAYQEALDLVMYLRQAIEERDQQAGVATGGLIPAGARLEVGALGCMLVVPAPGAKVGIGYGLPAVAAATADGPAAPTDDTVEPPTGPDPTSDTPEPAEAPTDDVDPADTTLCPGQGCGHPASRHLSHRSRGKQAGIGCWECDCTRSKERVQNGATASA